MPRLTFRERDITALIKAVGRSGYKGAFRVRIGQDGSIVLEIIELAPTGANEPAPALEPANEWDEVLDK